MNKVTVKLNNEVILEGDLIADQNNRYSIGGLYIGNISDHEKGFKVISSQKGGEYFVNTAEEAIAVCLSPSGTRELEVSIYDPYDYDLLDI